MGGGISGSGSGSKFGSGQTIAGSGFSLKPVQTSKSSFKYRKTWQLFVHF